MPSPFPGMDPYLEDPRWFPGLHDRLIVYLGEALKARLPRPYFAEVGSRLWIEATRRRIEPDVQVRHKDPARGPAPGVRGAGAVAVLPRSRPIVVTVPLVERRETFLEIRVPGDTGDRVVVAIEVFSPANKSPGDQGRDQYLLKQRDLLESSSHLVEIDLLRAGRHTAAAPRDLVEEAAGPFDYLVSVHRFDRVEDFEVYPIGLEDRLPEVALPLLPGDPDVTIDLQAVFDRVYDAGPYDVHVGYGEDAIVPSLDPDRMAWAAGIVRDAAKAP